MNENNEMMIMEEQGCNDFVTDLPAAEEHESKSDMGLGMALGAGITVGAYLLGKKVLGIIRKKHQDKKNRDELKMWRAKCCEEYYPEEDYVVEQEESTDNDSKK